MKKNNMIYFFRTYILDTTVMKSALPKRQLKLVLAWAELHKDELMQNWELVKESKTPLEIRPLS